MPTVLVGMDNDLGRGLVAHLRELDVTILVARSGVEVVSHLFPRGDSYAKAPTLMVLSALLPGYNGLSVLAGIRSLRWSTPVVMTWPTDEPWIQQEALRLGGSVLLEEPVGLQPLSQAVLTLLSQRADRATESRARASLR